MFAQNFQDGALAGKMFADARAFEEHPIRPTKLFIGGITRNTSTKMLRDHFSCFGRVLDCVAMRQPDGRPRGFGYVTLDSPAAAAQCLSDPQVIDGRIVDLKPAVAEGTIGTAPLVGNDTFGRVTPLAGLGLTPDHSLDTFLGKPWWATTFHKARGEVADCVDLLSGCPPPAMHAGPPGRFEDFSFNAAAKHTHCTAAAALSANAPEFVPSNQKPSSKPQILETEIFQPARIPELKTGKLTPRSILGGRAPFSELTNMDVAHQKTSNRKPFGEMTNLQSNNDAIKPLKLGTSPTAIIGTGSLSFPRSMFSRDDIPEVRSGMFVLEDDQFASENSLKDLGSHRSPTNSSIRDDFSGKGSFAVFVDQELSQAAVSTTSSPGELGGEAREIVLEYAEKAPAAVEDEDTDSDSDVSEIFTGELPSMGSAKHSAGECKRCNFFAKGRCLNGKECTFCHLPHEKRKPSRQEKRERREAWLLTQGESSLSEDTPTTDMHDRTQHRAKSDKQQLHLQPPSMPAVQSPSCMIGSPYPLLPPGLAPPLKSFESWQPDAEASPLGMRSLLMPRSMATTPAPISVGDASGIPASHPLADSNSPLLLSTVPSPVPSPVAAALKAAIPASLLKNPSTRTIGTQTELELICPCCGGNSATKMGGESSVSCGDELSPEKANGQSIHVHSGQWTRGELLSFRDSAEKAAPASAPAILFQSIPIPTAQP